jgi:hypothetical protein
MAGSVPAGVGVGVVWLAQQAMFCQLLLHVCRNGHRHDGRTGAGSVFPYVASEVRETALFKAGVSLVSAVRQPLVPHQNG